MFTGNFLGFIFFSSFFVCFVITISGKSALELVFAAVSTLATGRGNKIGLDESPPLSPEKTFMFYSQNENFAAQYSLFCEHPRGSAQSCRQVVVVMGGALLYPTALLSSGSQDESHNTNRLCDFQFVRDSAATAESRMRLALIQKRKRVIYSRVLGSIAEASAKWPPLI